MIIRTSVRDLKVLINEMAAMSASDAVSSNLALFVQRSLIKTSVILYDHELLLSMIRQGIEAALKDADKRFNLTYIQDVFRFRVSLSRLIGRDVADAIVGFIITKQPDNPCNGANEIMLSAARHGWGPLVYDVTMQTVGSLIPDRSLVSDAAKNIWKFYFKNRSDVKKSKLDDFKDPKTPPLEDDCELHKMRMHPWLDYSYSVSSNSTELSQCEQNHFDFEEECLRLFEQIDLVSIDPKEFLINLSKRFFDIVH